MHRLNLPFRFQIRATAAAILFSFPSLLPNASLDRLCLSVLISCSDIIYDPELESQ